MRGDVHDRALVGRTITVPEVRMSADLKHATVLVMPLGGEDREPVLAGLARERGRLRHELGRRVRLKFLPDLRFVLDTRFDDDDRIGALLDMPEVRRDLEDRGEDE